MDSFKLIPFLIASFWLLALAFVSEKMADYLQKKNRRSRLPNALQHLTRGIALLGLFLLAGCVFVFLFGPYLTP